MPRLLDLFCGAGGAAVGYSRAGWDVVGVDIEPQPDYPFEFRQGDALAMLRAVARGEWRGESLGYDAIHASPPCQAYTALQRGTNAVRGFRHPELYGPLRAVLHKVGLPYVIENPAARPDVVFCGEMFGLGVIRHRNFELGHWIMAQPEHKPHRGRVRGWRHGKFYDGPYISAYGAGGGKGTVAEMRAAMGIDWTTSRHSLVEAIPPVYTATIGAALLAHLEVAA